MLRRRMKTLHLYLTRQVLLAVAMTVAVFTFVLLLGNVLKEVLPLLVNRQASVLLLAKAIALLLPFVLSFALPMGMLTATLLVFGKFSAEQELTAARASGVSLISLSAPVILLGLLCCGVCGWMNLQLAPQSRVAFKQLLLQAGIRQANTLLPEGQFVKDFPGSIIYVGKNDGKNVSDVMVYLLEGGTNIFMRVHAPRGTFTVDTAAQEVFVRLADARIETLNKGEWMSQYGGEWTQRLDLKQATLAGKRVRISDMTFTQLRAEYEDMRAKLNSPGWGGKLAPAEWYRQRAHLLSPLRLYMHQRIAFSFACFGFTLIGIPLAIRVHRRETNIGVAIALGLVIVYYSFLILGQSLDSRPEFYPHLIVWIPNFLFQAVGGLLLWRANRA